jgi:hypothetical protein
LVPDDTEITFDVPVNENLPNGIVTMPPLRFSIRFNPNATPTQVRWNATSGIIRIDFDSWTNSLGSTMNQPVRLGEIPHARLLYLYVFHHRLGTTNRLDFQILTRQSS